MQHVDALSRCTNILVVETNSIEDNLVVAKPKTQKFRRLRNS